VKNEETDEFDRQHQRRHNYNNVPVVFVVLLTCNHYFNRINLLLVNSCYVSRGMRVRKQKATFKVIQRHRKWYHSI